MSVKTNRLFAGFIALFIVVILLEHFYTEYKSNVVYLTVEEYKQKTNEGRWLIAYAIPKNEQKKWVNNFFEPAAKEINYSGLDVNIAVVMTRPEFEDFSRKNSITDWPSIEMVNNGLVHKFNVNSIRDVERIVEFAEGGWLDVTGKPRVDLTRNPNLKIQ